MIINRAAANQPPQIENNKLAIPAGTGNVYSWDKFMWDKRDLNCTKCKNGMQSMVSKRINDKIYNVPVVCKCVPYVTSVDAEGVMTVAFNGRFERWNKGKRSEVAVMDEAVRKSANKIAVETKEVMQGPNEINGRKFQFVRAPHANTIPKEQTLSKSFPNMPFKAPASVQTEFYSDPNPQKVGDVTAKNLVKAPKGPQKSLKTLPNGNRVFVDDKTFARLSGQPVAKAVKAQAPPAGQPAATTGKRRGRPAKQVSAPIAGVPVAFSPQPAVSANVETAKRGRGRPKKVIAQV